MSDQDAGLSRDALIDVAAIAVIKADETTDDMEHGVPVWEQSDTLAAAAMDAVLAAVADDLEAHKDAWIENVDYLGANGGTQVGIDQAAGSAMALGVAAERVRGLLGKDKTNG